MNVNTGEIEETILSFYNAGRSKDFGRLNRFKAAMGYSKFDEVPPLSRQGASDATAYEELAFASLSDMRFEIRDVVVQPLSGNHALATFFLSLSGVLVDNYTFEGRKVQRESRVTMVLQREGTEWKILHHHASALYVGKEV